jgi:hypothetical protein
LEAYSTRHTENSMSFIQARATAPSTPARPF